MPRSIFLMDVQLTNVIIFVAEKHIHTHQMHMRKMKLVIFWTIEKLVRARIFHDNCIKFHTGNFFWIGFYFFFYAQIKSHYVFASIVRNNRTNELYLHVELWWGQNNWTISRLMHLLFSFMLVVKLFCVFVFFPFGMGNGFFICYLACSQSYLHICRSLVILN